MCHVCNATESKAIICKSLCVCAPDIIGFVNCWKQLVALQICENLSGCYKTIRCTHRSCFPIIAINDTMRIISDTCIISLSMFSFLTCSLAWRFLSFSIVAFPCFYAVNVVKIFWVAISTAKFENFFIWTQRIDHLQSVIAFRGTI